MGATLGSLCIVLHGHLPYVLNHGGAPHGEHWLFEAAAETYLPLLDVITDLAEHRAEPAFTIGLTPVLLEQLAHERFKTTFPGYLKDRAARAADDRKSFERSGESQQAFLADRWEKWYAQRLEQFENLQRDIPARFAALWRAGHVEMLTSSATHAYLPLLLNDPCIAAQIKAGAATSQRHLGQRSRGIWLAECAYRPASQNWSPAALVEGTRFRTGLEDFICGAGIDHFFVDTHLVAQGEPLGTCDGGHFQEVFEAQIYWDRNRGWRSPLEPVGVASVARPPSCYAMARHPKVSEQVWSSVIGYPGAAEYLEFHRKHGEGGLRYHRVTNINLGLGEKDLYYPENTFTRLYEQSQHFCNTVREVLAEHQRLTGREGIVLAPFDAELFGHWWFEGPQFLKNVMLTLSRDPAVRLTTSQAALESHPPDKVMRLPEGSWGENGDRTVWLNDQTRWIWEIEYRAENRLLELLRTLPWQRNGQVRQFLQRTAKELLLMQASDWPFVIHNRSALDYGALRFAGHATRFDRLATIAQDAAADRPLTDLQKIHLQESDAHDGIFENLDFAWWD